MRKALGGVAIAAILLWVAAFFILKSVHDSETQQMLAAADRINVPDDWELISERVESEKLICLNANPCPSVHRRWQATVELDGADLQALAGSAGLSLTVDSSCTRSENVFGNTTLCRASTSKDGYNFSFSITSPEPGADSVFVFGMETTDD